MQFSVVLYHVTSRGNGQEDIYLDDEDKTISLRALKEVSKWLNWIIHAYCLMPDHYHLLIETPDGKL